MKIYIVTKETDDGYDCAGSISTTIEKVFKKREDACKEIETLSYKEEEEYEDHYGFYSKARFYINEFELL